MFSGFFCDHNDTELLHEPARFMAAVTLHGYERGRSRPNPVNAMALIKVSNKPSKMKWHFPPTGGGIAQGFNDSSQEFFKANVLEHVIREIIQNSLDAKSKRRHDNPVIVHIGTFDLKSDAINCKELALHVKKSLEMSIEQKNQKAVTFYRRALNMLKRSSIPTLKVIDENTTGLNGMKWDALVHQEGTPVKDNASAGGSYGIGKNAPYAASDLSLVCYSTRYLDRHRIEKFIARCKLVAHYSPKDEKKELQHVGFGTSSSFAKNRFQPMMGRDINMGFRLAATGSGIYIVGFTEKDWQVISRRSIARNFFAAIHDKNLAVSVNGTGITNETLNDEDFGKDGHRHYYDLYKRRGKPIEVSKGFGNFNLQIAVGDDMMDNRIAYVNRLGMLITAEKSFKRNPFHARLGDVGRYVAIVCAADDKTDMRVRSMEPPTHEAIEYERIADQKERNKAERELRETNDEITRHIKKALGIDKFGSTTELTELADIIPFDIDEDSDTSNDGKDDNRSEHITYRKIPPPKSGIVPMGNEGSDGDADVEGNADDGTTGSGDPVRNNNARIGGVAKMEDARIVRHGNKLRVAFTPKTGTSMFAIMPAGEEYKVEDVVPIKHVHGVSENVVTIKLDNNTVTVNGAKNKRSILDITLGQDMQYTAYNIIDRATRRKRK